MPFGRSDAGLKSLSVYRASVVQRTHGLACATRCFNIHLSVFPLQYGDAIGGLRRFRHIAASP
jgi:hypothetical protein